MRRRDARAVWVNPGKGWGDSPIREASPLEPDAPLWLLILVFGSVCLLVLFGIWALAPLVA